MKNILNKNIFIIALSLLIGSSFVACSDWTENENIEVNIPNIGDMDPVVYAKYLENLRDYKKTDHKLVYTWYDNSVKVPVNRSHHLTALPDSIDVVSLMHPDNLSENELKEISTIRTDKGMKVILSISFDDIKNNFIKALGEDEVFDNDKFITHLTTLVNKDLALVGKYNYDGISFAYDGKSIVHLTPEELADYAKLQEAYLNLITTWYDGNKSKMIVFEGKPQNLLNKTILQSCNNIIINGMSEVSVEAFDFNIRMALQEGVPSDRFIVKVSTTSLDATDVKTGYFDQKNGVKAIPQTAIWIARPESQYKKAGIGIYNVQNDFFNPKLTYSTVRGAINTINPSPNN